MNQNDLLIPTLSSGLPSFDNAITLESALVTLDQFELSMIGGGDAIVNMG